MNITNKKLFFVTLGCRVNDFETNRIKQAAIENKCKIVDAFETADIAIINTCCVTNKAMSKSKYFIRKVNKAKKIKLVVVCGCFSQYNQDYDEEKVGIIIGTKYKSKLIDLIKKYDGKKIVKVDDVMKENNFETSHETCEFSKTRSICKIQDGCNFNCTYCIIPYVRGKQRSLSHKIIIEDIKKMIDKNIKEIVLTGVNTSGYDDGKINFYELLKKINKMDGDFRVRISSLEPFQINEKILDIITNNKKRWCQSFHLCLQSANDEILKEMNRKYAFDSFKQLCMYIRKKSIDASITTDYIVGFPTETNERFSDGCKNLESLKLSNIHIFPFSSHKNTPASKLKNIVSDTQKSLRFKVIENINKKNRNAYLHSMINKTANVLFEQTKDKQYQNGHSEYFFKVYVKTTKDLSKKQSCVKLQKIFRDGVLGIIC
ncbi:MAG: tRNA (N(6)-L-threonylcarbamoyladenosine(37)-C(2))-methylthiotransferase MtaB [Mycoplasmataceae bacterium]|jgi:threonylcarbamoyladenosine tRNA methylthiotransferase MtaB|nr:tRNA (N(6)-L-threonylcarbamoyladenosine(37)-C(2))-methylthiotransferase MtaB [Mycoplasmataceae bacterium]